MTRFAGFAFAAAFAAPQALALDRLETLNTRPGVTVEYWRMPRDDAVATLILLPGGEGGIGAKRGGPPTSRNFLVRTRDAFADAGFNVLVMGKPSDRSALDPHFRASAEHVADVRALVEAARKEFGRPVWLVGTSRGTISAAAAAAELPPEDLGGIVLSSSITNGEKMVPVGSLDLAAIRVPVMLLHHRRDECRFTQPARAQRLAERFASAPVRKFVMVDGGAGASGNPCEAVHWHGYIGMESEAAKSITDWIRSPTR